MEKDVHSIMQGGERSDASIVVLPTRIAISRYDDDDDVIVVKDDDDDDKRTGMGAGGLESRDKQIAGRSV